ncbi:ATP-dependent RNA helicase [Spirochaetia bacterium 38H-sp]|uniref:RNA helicase n=1 Tax=Rarispira pelagica TaxID=3141764 RepID=A0ABU9UC33_9SPIR
MDSKKLPVYQQKDKILEALREHQVIVVESPTGSGKTTQIPVILDEAGYTYQGVVGITQPRRIAAVSVSDFIAKQVGSKIPGHVGYKMRFEDMTCPDTKIKVMTDGILLQELKHDPQLLEYSVIIVDEAHERSLNIDFILGLLKRILKERPTFRVIVSSATLNTEVFSQYFDNCPIISIETRTYPVDTLYIPITEEEQDDEEAIIKKKIGIVEKVVRERRKGDVLIFEPGERDIKLTISYLEKSPIAKKLKVLPLYARLSKEEQEEVFPPAPRGKTKVVVATNIAETSVTIDGITTVIDPGRAKLNYYNPRTYTSSLVEMPISKASAEQRTGRAGRTQPGTCYRLYSPEDFKNREEFTKEEIYRTDLSEVVLRMADLGIKDFESFDFISPPEKSGILSAIETLELLEAIDSNRELTPIGKLMVQFPLLPRHSRMIIEAIYKYPSVVREVLIAASFLTTKSPFLLPQDQEMEARNAHHHFRDKQGDFVSYLKIFRDFRTSKNREKFCDTYYLDIRVMEEILNIEQQLESIVEELGFRVEGGGPIKDYLCAIARGHIQFVCIKAGRSSYKSLTADKIEIHPGSVIFRETPQYIVAGEIVKTSKTFARSVSPLKPQWLDQISYQLSKRLEERAKERKTKTEKQKSKKGALQEIILGGKHFTLATKKGKKKQVVLPWQDLQAAIKKGAELPHYYADIRGKIIYGQYQLMSGEKLIDIVEAARHIKLPRDLQKDWPRGINFYIKKHKSELLQSIYSIMVTSPIKKQSKRLGFVTLRTDNNGTYWYACHKNHIEAAKESLAAIETLIEQTANNITQEEKSRINKIYRKLSNIVESETENTKTQ